MILGKPFEAFVQESPVSVMVCGILERIFDPQKLDQVFAGHALLGYAKELTFASCVQLMSAVVFRTYPSVGAYYQDQQHQLPVTRQAVYQKLQHLELPVAAALVRYAAEELLPCLKALPGKAQALLPGYRLRILDGNHLAGTEHRPLELRCFRAAVLPGQALVSYDPQFDLVTEVIPCEDAYAQERSLLDAALACIAAGECVLADRNFCTTGFLFGLQRRQAFFLIRQPKATLHWELKGRRRSAGKDSRGRAVYEQTMQLTDPDTAEVLIVRRVTIVLDKPTQTGDRELHILTNLPSADAGAVRVAELYAARWTVETAFWHLTEDLRCEIDTLAYPKAALFGFCTALVAYNAVALVKGALRAAQGRTYVEEELSMYYLTLEVSRVTAGMQIAIPAAEWDIFRTMSQKRFVATLVELAQGIDRSKYTKHGRGPKKPQPRKISGKKNHHVSTARILAGIK
jgi:hypothetical protein